jgi:hypothetical protein
LVSVAVSTFQTGSNVISTPASIPAGMMWPLTGPC